MLRQESPPRVLIAGVNQVLAQHVADELRRESVEVTITSTLVVAVARDCDVLLVEARLDDWKDVHDGFGPSVIAIADQGNGDLVASCFMAGADDVVTRTDRPHELVARIRAIARRRPRRPERPLRLVVGGVELDPVARSVTVDGRPVRLTRRQFDLLEYFLINAGRVLTRGTLLDNVWGPDGVVDSNAVELQVRRLREALEADPRHPIRLRTIRGVGYLYERAAS